MVLTLLIACAETPSVKVAIVDTAGAPFTGATVEYRVDRGEYVPAECATGAEPGECSEYVAGRGVVGELDVTASWEGEETSACCWQYSFAMETVTVAAGPFGSPATQRVTLVIDESDEICGDCGTGG